MTPMNSTGLHGTGGVYRRHDAAGAPASDDHQMGLYLYHWAADAEYGPAQLPKPLGEFVVVHELVPLLVPNQGRVFKSFLYAYLPDWEEREQRLEGGTGQRSLGHQLIKVRYKPEG